MPGADRGVQCWGRAMRVRGMCFACKRRAAWRWCHKTCVMFEGPCTGLTDARTAARRHTAGALVICGAAQRYRPSVPMEPELAQRLYAAMAAAVRLPRLRASHGSVFARLLDGRA